MVHRMVQSWRPFTPMGSLQFMFSAETKTPVTVGKAHNDMKDGRLVAWVPNHGER